MRTEEDQENVFPSAGAYVEARPSSARQPTPPSAPPPGYVRVPPPPPPPPARQAARPSSSGGNGDFERVVADTDTLPCWARTEFCAQDWKSVLDECGCDERSQQTLFLLSSFTDHGWIFANQVISVMIKKLSDQESWWYKSRGLSVWRTSPSAFLHKAVLDARHKVCERLGIDHV